MNQDSLSQLMRHTEEAVSALGHVMERVSRLARDMVDQGRFVATRPPAVADELRRGAEELVDLSTAWMEPVRRLSEDHRRFAEEMATWAERHRAFAEEMASWADTQRSFAEHMASVSSPLLGYSEQLAEATKGLLRVAMSIPGAGGPTAGPAGRGDPRGHPG